MTKFEMGQRVYVTAPGNYYDGDWGKVTEIHQYSGRVTIYQIALEDRESQQVAYTEDELHAEVPARFSAQEETRRKAIEELVNLPDFDSPEAGYLWTDGLLPETLEEIHARVDKEILDRMNDPHPYLEDGYHSLGEYYGED